MVSYSDENIGPRGPYSNRRINNLKETDFPYSVKTHSNVHPAVPWSCRKHVTKAILFLRDSLKCCITQVWSKLDIWQDWGGEEPKESRGVFYKRNDTREKLGPQRDRLDLWTSCLNKGA